MISLSCISRMLPIYIQILTVWCCDTLILLVIYPCHIFPFLTFCHLPFWGLSFLQLCIILSQAFPEAFPSTRLGVPQWGMIFHLLLCAFSFVLQWYLNLYFSFLKLISKRLRSTPVDVNQAFTIWPPFFAS